MLRVRHQGPEGGGNDALHRACSAGLPSRVSSLLESCEIKPDDHSCFISCDSGNAKITQMLLDKGVDSCAVNDDGASLLHVAATGGHTEVADVLIAAGSCVDAIHPASGASPLICATISNSPTLMESLLEAGCNVDQALPDGRTSMYLAAERNNTAAVKILLQNNADACLETVDEFSPLDVAAGRGYFDVVCLLIGACGGPNRMARPLHLAAQSGHVDIMTILCCAGARDMKARALCGSISHGGEQAVKFLLDHSALFPRNYASLAEDGVSPLLCCLAAPSPSVRVLRRLVDAGATTNVIFVRMRENKPVTYTPLEMIEQRNYDEKLQGSRRDYGVIAGMRRLLIQEEAVHSVSWCWPDNTPLVNSPPNANLHSPHMVAMVQRQRKRARSPKVPRVASNFNRYISKEDPRGSKDRLVLNGAKADEAIAEAERVQARAEEEGDEEACAIAAAVAEWVKTGRSEHK